ncbi:MAG: nucleotidyltransferase domain-containing protein [Candidatus Promineifilaceae bacterium]
MSLTPYPDLNSVLSQFVTSVQAILQDNFIAAYLQGSFAMGDFDEYSDVDWIILIERDLNDVELSALQTMHGRLFDQNIIWAKHLEGSYIPRAMFGQNVVLGTEAWYLDNGSRQLIRDAHCNDLVVRWVTREFGIAMAGPEANTLIQAVHSEELREEIWGVICDWGQDILNRREQFRNRFYVSFIVLSFCRMLHSLETARIHSKKAGAAWAKAWMNPAQCRVIDHALADRGNSAVRVRQRPPQANFERMLQFVAEAREIGRKARQNNWQRV